jgi:amino acid permease
MLNGGSYRQIRSFSALAAASTVANSSTWMCVCMAHQRERRRWAAMRFFRSRVTPTYNTWASQSRAIYT